MAQNIIKSMGLDGGVNLFQDPHSLQDNEVTNCQNAYPDKDGIITTRPSATAIQRLFVPDPDGSGNSVTFAPRALVVPGNYPFDAVVAQVTQNQATWGFIALTAGISELDLFPAAAVAGTKSTIFGPITNEMSERPSFFTFNGELWAVVGDGAFQGVWRLTDQLAPWNPQLDPAPPVSPTGYYWVHYDFDMDSFSKVKPGYVITAGSGLAATAYLYNIKYPMKPKHATTYLGRVVYANFGPGMKNWLVFSDQYSPSYQAVVNGTVPIDPSYDEQDAWFPAPLWVGTDALAANGRHLVVEGMPADDEIVAVKEITLRAVGTPVDAALLILGKRSAFIMTGQPVQTTDATATTLDAIFRDIKIQQVNYACGCASEYTVFQTKYGTLWADGEEVWVLTEGTAPIPVGRKISPVLKDCPPERRWQWTATYHDGFYMLGIVTQSSVSADEPQFEYWWLDLRRGPPQSWEQARWYGPMKYEWKDAFGIPTYMSNPAIDSRVSSGNFGKPVVVSASPYPSLRHQHIVDLIGDTQLAMDTPLGNVSGAGRWTDSAPLKRGQLMLPTGTFGGNPENHFGSPGAPDGNQHIAFMDLNPELGDPTMGSPEPVWPSVIGVFLGPANTWVLDQNIMPVPIFTDIGGEYSVGNYDSNDVLIDVTTKEFAFDDSFITKTLDHVEMDAEVPHPTMVDIDVIQNGGSKVSQVERQMLQNPGGARPQDMDEDPETRGFVLGSSILGGDETMSDMRSVASFYPNEMRPLITARTMSFRIRNRAGIIIDESNNKLDMCLEDYDTGQIFVPGGMIRATIPNGYHPDIFLLGHTISFALQMAIAPWLGVYMPFDTQWHINYGASPTLTQPLRQLYYNHGSIWPTPSRYTIKFARYDYAGEFALPAAGEIGKRLLRFLAIDTDYVTNNNSDWIANNMAGLGPDYVGWSGLACTPFRTPGKMLIHDVFAEVIPNPRRPR